MTDRTISWAAGALVAHLAQRDRLLAGMHAEASAQPGAQGFEQDRVTGHETHLFCWEHEQDPADCHHQGRWAGDTLPHADTVAKTARRPCTGQPIPAAADPTGELAARQARHSDPALAAERELERLEAQVVKAVEKIQAIRDEYAPAPAQLPTKVVLASVSHDGEPGCESCARLILGQDGDRRPLWSEPNYNRGEPTNLGGALERRMRLCRPCAEWALNHSHDRCLEQAAQARKAKKGRKVLTFDNRIHLPPVSEGEENLDNKRRTGYWRGKPGRAA